LVADQNSKTRNVSGSNFSKHVNNVQLLDGFSEMHEKAKRLPFLNNIMKGKIDCWKIGLNN